MTAMRYDRARKLVEELAATLNAVIDAAKDDDWDAVELMMRDFGTVHRKASELNKAMIAAGLGEPFYA